MHKSSISRVGCLYLPPSQRARQPVWPLPEESIASICGAMVWMIGVVFRDMHPITVEPPR